MMHRRSLLTKAVQPAFMNTVRMFGAGEKQLKIRMKSVKSIGKITKAMKMVSAAKMRQELARLERGRDFGHDAIDMIFKSDQFMQRKMPAEVNDPNIVFVSISSDKGLCGAVNSGVVRDIKKTMIGQNRDKVKMFSIGDKGTAGLTRPFPDCLKFAMTHVGTPYNYPTIMALAHQVGKGSEDADKIIVVYNQFQSAISYVQKHLELMPRNKFLESMKYAKLYNQTLPDKNTSNFALYELYLTSNIWVAFLNNAASEQSSRMAAMDNASKNAKEIFEKLQLKYNKARQARITVELCEIIAGATAL